MWGGSHAKFEELEGKTLIEVSGEVGDSQIFFTTSDKEVYRLYHDQD